MAAGKPVSSLKAGTYDVVVQDDSASGGLFVRKAHHSVRTLTGIAFRGKRTVRVTLTAGSWAYFAAGTRETTFVVTR